MSSLRHWPDTLPTPTGPDYALEPHDPFLRTDMEAGEARQRRITRAERDHVTASWILDPDEIVAFRAWFADSPWSLAGNSDDLAGWAATNAGWSPAAALAPSGVAAGRIVETSASGGHVLERTISGIAAEEELWACATLRAAGRSEARLDLVGRDDTARWLRVDLGTGAILAQSGLADARTTARGSGWWRLQLRASAGSGSAAVRLRLRLMNAGAIAYAGDPALGIDAAEVNVRRADGPSLYLPTDAAGAVRGAAGGAAWTVMPVFSGRARGRFVNAETRFAGMWRATLLPGLKARIAAPLEVRHA